MDWDLKMPPPWDLAELESNTEPNIGLIVGSSSGMGIQASGHRRQLDCSVDLKLGGLGDFGRPENRNDHQLRVPMATAVPPSGPSKRARAASNGSQNVSCLVDGCKADLSGCREYHRRHKVCEAHSKTPIVMVGGQEQRFCQQCSRFHLLVEFDEVKRSCRKRLDGHNRRRRKPQTGSINPGSIFSNHQGTGFSSYPQIFPSAASDPPWPVIVKTEEDQLYSRQFHNRQHHHFTGSFARSFREGSKHFPFLQDGDALMTVASAESSCSGSKIFPDGLTQVLDSDCALSLLSSPPRTSAMNLGQIVASGDRVPMDQPLLPYGASLGLRQHSGLDRVTSRTGFSCSGILEDDHLGSTVLVSDGSDAEMNCHGLFGVGGEGSSQGGSQALPFSWQ